MSIPTDTGSPTPQTRREFCAQACRAASFITVGSLAACSGSPSSPSAPAPQTPAVAATLNGRVLSIALDTATALSAVGSAGIAQTTLGSFLVAHTGQNTYTAVSATCTHEGCVVSGFADGRYVCPCHGSQYATSGAVVIGPATRALPQYPTQVSGTTLTFTV